MENLGIMLGTHWELDRNTIRTWWEQQQKSKKSNTPSPFEPKKKLGPLGACWLTSLAAKENFYAYLSSLPIFGLG
jgi:hypothetical protein